MASLNDAFTSLSNGTTVTNNFDINQYKGEEYIDLLRVYKECKETLLKENPELLDSNIKPLYKGAMDISTGKCMLSNIWFPWENGKGML